MFSVFELQIALMRMWIRSFDSLKALLLSRFAPRYAEQSAAAGAKRELDRIVRMHAAEPGHRATNA